MATDSGKTDKAKPSEKSAGTSSKKEARKEKDKPKPIGDGEGPTKF